MKHFILCLLPIIIFSHCHPKSCDHCHAHFLTICKKLTFSEGINHKGNFCQFCFHLLKNDECCKNHLSADTLEELSHNKNHDIDYIVVGLFLFPIVVGVFCYCSNLWVYIKFKISKVTMNHKLSSSDSSNLANVVTNPQIIEEE
jgi:hypothetical protein